jgi:internalin A
VSIPYSARNNRGRAGLEEALRDAVAYLRERQGVAMIGKGRLHVQRALQALRDADAALPPEQRQCRTIDQARFRALCNQAGNVSSPEHLLAYLHNAGIVFYRTGLFQDRIVLDQGWALDAIYTVFNRDKCVKELRRLRGRFTRPLLDLFAWSEHSENEQRLFLDMMTQCGICFVHRQGPHDDPDATEYIAPDLLPERVAMEDELASVWDKSLPTVSEDIPFEMLHPGLVRGLICAIGGEAGTDAKYWFGGVAFYETQTRSHALIEQHMADAWHGVIRVQTQGGDAARLHEQLCAWIDRRSGHDGLKAARSARRPMPVAEEIPAPDTADKPPGIVGPAPRTAPEYFVSYAWGDDLTPEGKDRETIVDRLCAAAEARDPPIRIVRDKTTLRTGDPIMPFMQRIGAGDRVFVILSEKYLRSPWCMFELLEVWRHSRADPDDFRRRVRVYALPDAKAATTRDRIANAVYWKQEHDGIEATIKEHGAAVLGTHDFEAFKRMGEFYRSVPDILATLFNTVQPRTFE